jgi:hypothetical protein
MKFSGSGDDQNAAVQTASKTVFVITGILRTGIFRALAHAADAQGEDRVNRRAGLSIRMPSSDRESVTLAP